MNQRRFFAMVLATVLGTVAMPSTSHARIPIGVGKVLGGMALAAAVGFIFAKKKSPAPKPLPSEEKTRPEEEFASKTSSPFPTTWQPGNPR